MLCGAVRLPPLTAHEPDGSILEGPFAAYLWGFPKIRGTILGVPITRLKYIEWGLFWWYLGPNLGPLG